MKKDRKRKRAFQNKPTHSIFLGSSNNIATHHLTQFCLPVENRSLPSGSPSVASRNNYIIQAGTKIDRKGIYLIFLSFNNILRDVHQLTSCQTEYVKRVKQTLNILASYGLNLRKNLIISTPPLRFTQDTWPIQKQIIQDLVCMLDEKKISHFNCLKHICAGDLQPHKYYSKKDQLLRKNIHLSKTILKIIAETAASELKNFLKEVWNKVV